MIPGWMRGAVGCMEMVFGGLMVVDNLDLLGVGAGPTEADAPWVVDSDGMLSAAISSERLQTIAGRQLEESQLDGGIDELQLDERALPDLTRQAARAPRQPQLFGVAVGKAFDHPQWSADPRYSSSG